MDRERLQELADRAGRLAEGFRRLAARLRRLACLWSPFCNAPEDYCLECTRYEPLVRD